jgi:DNA transformation protein
MADTSFRDFVLDQLAGLPGLDARAMFGGHGLYLDGEFFGMIWKGRLWFRTDERSREEYRALGADPIPFGDDLAENVYWSVPEDVLEHAGRLAEWARAAAATPRPEAQRRARRGRKAAKPKPRRARVGRPRSQR